MKKHTFKFFRSEDDFRKVESSSTVIKSMFLLPTILKPFRKSKIIYDFDV